MGAYVSKDECPSYFHHAINCTRGWTIDDGNNVTTMIGSNGVGQIEPDGDIAGIGVITAFIAVTSLALSLSIVDVLWTFYKFATRKPQRKYANTRWPSWSFSGLLETIILSCSDQQVFTGGAYAITLRYYKGCSITAYHYNIVANIMLLTCATHLMTVTIVRDYFKLPAVAFCRVLLISLLMVVTGLLLSNQNAKGAKFPTTVPGPEDETAAMFFPAACFQDKDSQFGLTWGQTFTTAAQFGNTIITSRPGDNTIHGWNLYIIILLFYVVSLLIESVRFIRRGLSRDGRRQRLVQWAKGFVFLRFLSSRGAKASGHFFLCLFMLGGAGFCTYTVIDASQFIMNLRAWAKHSGWLQMDEETKDSSEDDVAAFGQLVPMLLMLLTVFSLIATLNEMFQESRKGRRLTLSGNLTPHSSAMLSPAGPSRTNSYNPEKLLAPSNIEAAPTTWSAAAAAPGFAAAGTPGTVAGFAGNGSVVMLASPGSPGTAVTGQSPNAGTSVVRFDDSAGATPLYLQGGYFVQQPQQQQQQNVNDGMVDSNPSQHQHTGSMTSTTGPQTYTSNGRTSAMSSQAPTRFSTTSMPAVAQGTVVTTSPPREAQTYWSPPPQPQVFYTTPALYAQAADSSTPLTQEHEVMGPPAEIHSDGSSATPGVAVWSPTYQQEGTVQQGQYRQYQQ